MERQLLAGLAAPSDCENKEPELHTICTDYQIAANIVHALNTGYPEFCEAMPVHDRTVSICGSAPSLKRTWPELSGDIWVCNDAGWMLMDRGIVPTYWMVWDPQPLVIECFRRTHQDTTYLVASMCDPGVFDLLKSRGHKVIIWHPWMGDALPIMEWLVGAESKSRLLCGFGLEIPGTPPDQVVATSAAVSRSAQMAPLFGYRDIRLHGMDSSCERGVVHFEDLRVDHGQLLIATWVSLLGMPGTRRKFVTTPQMRRQIKEFVPLVRALHAMECRVTVHGDGAIPWLALLKGWHVNNHASSDAA